MANLKFNEISWGDKSLMYVEFLLEGRKLRWYPKWKEVAELLGSSYSTEQGLNQDKLTHYLLFTMLSLVMRDLLIRKTGNNDQHIDLMMEYNRLHDKISQAMLERKL